MSIQPARIKECLGEFDFHRLFVEQLGWSQPSSAKTVTFRIGDEEFSRRQIAQLGGVLVFEATSASGVIPAAKLRAAVHKAISALHHENLLIFIDRERTQSLWYWVKREDGKSWPRDHYFEKHQPGDLFLSKLTALVFDIGELDAATGDVSVVEVAKRLREALDIERVTRKFYDEFRAQHVTFLDLIGGIENDRDRRWYASVLLNRLMFIYFLQKKGFIDDNDQDYLQHKLEATQKQGADFFYSSFLKLLFFEGFAKTEDKRSAGARRVLGKIKYLNGGLFLPHKIEQENPHIAIPDKAFENILGLFRRYSWNLNDTPGGDDNEINPDVLGYIFEKYINQKAFGAYYTPPEITEFLCERTIHFVILDKVRNTPFPGSKNRDYKSISDMLMDLDNDLCRVLIHEILPNLSVLDPACGSGAFLVSAMKTLLNIYGPVVGKIKFSSSANLKRWLSGVERDHPSLGYFIRKTIITDNLFGVDIMEEASEIARLRLFLALVASADDVNQLEPLPNIDFNILPGNSLIGLMRVDDQDFDRRHRQGNLFQKSYRELLAEKNQLVANYRHASTYAEDLTSMRDSIREMEEEAEATLDEILLKEFTDLGIKHEQPVWDTKAGELGKTSKRPVRLSDIQALQPFHWGYQFDEILNGRGGFDVIVGNPPWEVFKPNAKEFFEQHSKLVSKNNMTIHEFETEQSKLLKNAAIREAWIDYLSGYPHQAAWFRSAATFRNQTSVVNRKKIGTDTNFYKLFVEQAFNLLRNGGRCGIITPGGIYADLGAKRLREMLLFECRVDSLIGLTNERYIFEGVEHRQKFCILAFEKGGSTESFRAAFRINTREAISRDKLDEFLNSGKNNLLLATDLIRRLSPDSLSIMEFKNETDVRIAEKMLRFPLLGEEIPGSWNLHLTREFDMTNDSDLYLTSPGADRLPLFEGKMISQFTSAFGQPRYWVQITKGRHRILGNAADTGQKLGPDCFRVSFRDVASNTNERTMISAILPPCFFGHTISAARVLDAGGKNILSGAVQAFLCGVWNSFTVDYLMRSKVSSHVSFFYVYQLPVPRLAPEDPSFKAIEHRAARLICATPAFDAFAHELGLNGHEDGATDPAERARLRAELDGIIANLYGLTEDEFAYLLTTFPVVKQQAKDAALAAFREFAPKSVDQQITALIAAGESSTVEFKSSVRWDMRENRLSEPLKYSAIKTVAAYLNSSGGTLLIGVDDERKVVGLQGDYSLFRKTDARDAFENWLTTQLIDQFGKPSTRSYAVTFHEVGGHDVCRIEVQPSPTPVYVDDKSGKPAQLYIRTGNASRALETREIIEYARHRWPVALP